MYEVDKNGVTFGPFLAVQRLAALLYVEFPLFLLDFFLDFCFLSS